MDEKIYYCHGSLDGDDSSPKGNLFYVKTSRKWTTTNYAGAHNYIIKDSLEHDAKDATNYAGANYEDMIIEEHHGSNNEDIVEEHHGADNKDIMEEHDATDATNYAGANYDDIMKEHDTNINESDSGRTVHLSLSEEDNDTKPAARQKKDVGHTQEQRDGRNLSLSEEDNDTKPAARQKKGVGHTQEQRDGRNLTATEAGVGTAAADAHVGKDIAILTNVAAAAKNLATELVPTENVVPSRCREFIWFGYKFFCKLVKPQKPQLSSKFGLRGLELSFETLFEIIHRETGHTIIGQGAPSTFRICAFIVCWDPTTLSSIKAGEKLWADVGVDPYFSIGNREPTKLAIPCNWIDDYELIQVLRTEIDFDDTVKSFNWIFNEYNDLDPLIIECSARTHYQRKSECGEVGEWNIRKFAVYWRPPPQRGKNRERVLVRCSPDVKFYRVKQTFVDNVCTCEKSIAESLLAQKVGGKVIVTESDDSEDDSEETVGGEQARPKTQPKGEKKASQTTGKKGQASGENNSETASKRDPKTDDHRREFRIVAVWKFRRNEGSIWV
jgi:hypothetical protein